MYPNIIRSDASKNRKYRKLYINFNNNHNHNNKNIQIY
jgi:hypothetical protein